MEADFSDLAPIVELVVMEEDRDWISNGVCCVEATKDEMGLAEMLNSGVQIWG